MRVFLFVFPRLSQPFLVCQVIQAPDHPHGPLLDSLLCAHVSLVLGSSEVDPVLQVSHRCSTEGKDHLLRLAGDTMTSTAQGAVCFSLFISRYKTQASDI